MPRAVTICLLTCVGNYVLNYVATRPKLANFVVQALVTLFARITKLGWFDTDKEEFVFRNVVSDITKFLQVGGRPRWPRSRVDPPRVVAGLGGALHGGRAAAKPADV